MTLTVDKLSVDLNKPYKSTLFIFLKEEVTWMT